MDQERDLSDLGVKWSAEAEEREELAPDEVFVPPPATPADRVEAVERLRRDLGWGPSAAGRLAEPCRCGAAAGAWCGRRGRRRHPVVGRLCPSRGRNAN